MGLISKLASSKMGRAAACMAGIGATEIAHELINPAPLQAQTEWKNVGSDESHVKDDKHLNKKLRLGDYVSGLFVLPHTLVHESSHALTGLLMGYDINEFRIFPNVHFDDLVQAGYVEFKVNPNEKKLHYPLISITPTIVDYASLLFLNNAYSKDNFNMRGSSGSKHHALSSYWISTIWAGWLGDVTSKRDSSDINSFCDDLKINRTLVKVIGTVALGYLTTKVIQNANASSKRQNIRH